MADPPDAVRLEAKQHEVRIIDVTNGTGLPADQAATIVPSDESQASYNARLFDFGLDLRREGGVSDPDLLAPDQRTLTWRHQHRVRRVVAKNTLEIPLVVGSYDSRGNAADLPNVRRFRPALLCGWGGRSAFAHEKDGQQQGCSPHSSPARRPRVCRTPRDSYKARQPFVILAVPRHVTHNKTDRVPNDTRIGVDIAKAAFQIAVSERPGRVSRCDCLRRGQFLFLAASGADLAHGLRQGWITERTTRLNALRGLLRELGVFIPLGRRTCCRRCVALVEDVDSELPDTLRPVFAAACSSPAGSRATWDASPSDDGYLRTTTPHLTGGVQIRLVRRRRLGPALPA